MITIRPVRQEEIPAVKTIIHSVAYNIFGFNGTLEDSIQHYEDQRVFKDLEDVRANYFEAGGIFLIALNGREIIGSGAVRRLSEDRAELKRMWLLEMYHGLGIGYRLVTRLFAFAREKGYTRICLQTSPEQTRALAFYRKVGFTEISCYNEDFDEISMEIPI